MTGALGSTGPGSGVSSGSPATSNAASESTNSSTGASQILACNLARPVCPAGEECMPWAQDGGTEPNAARCSLIADAPGAAGEACRIDGDRFSGVDDCADGLSCSEVDDTTDEGLCRQLCPSGKVCDDPETSCIAWFDGALPVCSRTCTNLSRLSCTSGNACYALPVTGNCGFAACGHQVGVGAQGNACTRLNDCENGFQCVDGSRVSDCESDRCCTQYCDLSGLDGCNALEGTSCDTEVSSANCPPMLYEVGVCLIP